MRKKSSIYVLFALFTITLLWFRSPSIVLAEEAPAGIAGLEQQIPEGYMTVEEAIQEMREAGKEFREGYVLRFAAPVADFDSAEDAMYYVSIHTQDYTGKPKEGEYLFYVSDVLHGVPRYETCGDYYCIEADIVVEPRWGTSPEIEKQVDAKVAEILAELNLEDKSTQEKALAIAKYVRTHVEYDYEHLLDTSYKPQFTAYAAFLNNKAVCQGIALMYMRLALEAGVECRYVHSNSMVHGWNMVKMDDGKWYFVDCTWDLGGIVPFYALKGKQSWKTEHMDISGTSDLGVVMPEHVPVEEAYDIAEGDVEGPIERGFVAEGIDWVYYQDYTLGVELQEGYTTGIIPSYSTTNRPEWFDFRLEIDHIKVGEGITRIGDFAFDMFSNVQDISLPDTLTTIGNSAFRFCDKLQAVQLPEAIERIEDHAFEGDVSLKELRLPESLQYVGEKAFERNYTLEKVVIECPDITWGEDVFYWDRELTTMGPIGSGCNVEYKQVETIKEGTFPTFLYVKKLVVGDAIKRIPSYMCQLFLDVNCIEEVILPEGLQGIDDYAFFATALKSIQIPESVEEIGSFAFSYCNDLTGTIYISSNVKKMGAAFLNCPSVTKFQCDFPARPDNWPESWKDGEILVEWTKATPVQINGIGFDLLYGMLYLKVPYEMDEAYVGNMSIWIQQGDAVSRYGLYNKEGVVDCSMKLTDIGQSFTIYVYSQDAYTLADGSKQPWPMVNSDGDGIEGDIIKFSFEEYAEAVIAGEYSQEIKAIVADLLVYGECFDAYFKESEDSGETKEPVICEIEAPGLEIDGELPDGWEYLGMSAFVGDYNIYTKLYFSGDLGEYSLQEVFPVGIAGQAAEGIYYVYMNYSISDFAYRMTIPVVFGDKQVAYTYSLLDYYALAMEQQTDVALCNLIAAMYQLSVDAHNYVLAMNL